MSYFEGGGTREISIPPSRWSRMAPQISRATMQDRLAPAPLRVEPFELDPRSGQLRHGEARHHLSDQPLAILKALAERPGELVTREELRRRLWPDGTFVGFDHGLNSAINRLREVLNDSAESPRFIETIPRRGYRLLVPIQLVEDDRGVDVEPAARVAPVVAPSASRLRRHFAWIVATNVYLRKTSEKPEKTRSTNF